MLYMPYSKIVDSSEAAVAPAAVITAEGQALVVAKNNQAGGVYPSTGAAGEVFAGFSVATTSAVAFPEAYTNKVETFVVPAGGAVHLSLEPVPGQVSVWDVTAGAVAADAVVAGKEVSGLTAGNTVEVTYKYAMSVVQARAAYGDVQPGGYVGAYVGQIGLVKRGLIFTSEFDASKDWKSATEIKLAANGQLTTGLAGIAIDGRIVSLPSSEVPFLGIEFSAA